MSVKSVSRSLPSRRLSTPVYNRLFDSGRFILPFFHREQVRSGVVAIAVPVIVGLALGGVLVFARGLSPEWKGLVILATIAPTVALLFRDINKLMLIALVVDIPLGLDIALVKRLGPHSGGPNGFLITPMTMVLVIGYGTWIARRSFGEKESISTQTDITAPALVYLLAMLLSAFQATEMWYSITELFLHAQLFLMYFFLINHAKDWSSVRLLSTTLVICLLLESLVMLAQYFTGLEVSALGISTNANGTDIESATLRAAGTFSGANSAGTFLATTLAITFAACLANNRLINSKLAFITLLIGTAALTTTLSRSALSAFGLSLLIIILQAARRRLGLRASLMLLILAALLLVGFSTQLTERFTDSGQQSAEARVLHAKLAFNILDDYMFTGVGLNNTWFVVAQGDYLPFEMIGRRFTRIHNKYLGIWVESGLFGLLAFVWLLLAGARRALLGLIHAKDRYTSLAITGLLAALFVYSWHMLTAAFSGRDRLQLLWLFLALIAIIAELAQHQDELNDRALEPRPAQTKRTILQIIPRPTYRGSRKS